MVKRKQDSPHLKDATIKLKRRRKGGEEEKEERAILTSNVYILKLQVVLCNKEIHTPINQKKKNTHTHTVNLLKKLIQ